MRSLFFVLLLSLFASIQSFAQYDIITAFAGNGTTGYSGDGGAASMAGTGYPNCIAIDRAGNKYITGVGAIRKINTSGIITTIAGTGIAGTSGNGGPATAAQVDPGFIIVDSVGNIFFTNANYTIRKINTSGIITTIAGTGMYGNTGDGGPATAAQMIIGGLAFDINGDILVSIAGTWGSVRKINSSGIITTIIGTGLSGFSGDGGPATAAQLNNTKSITLDAVGNIYIADYDNYRIRMVNTAGIISTIAGDGTAGGGGDGGPATAAQIIPVFIRRNNAGEIFFVDNSWRLRKINSAGIISAVSGIGGTATSFSCAGEGGLAVNADICHNGFEIDQMQNIYVASNPCGHIYKIHLNPEVVSDSFAAHIDKLCSGLNITTVVHSSAPLYMKINYGDNMSSGAIALTPTTSGYQSSFFSHSYANPGTYTIRMILLNGTIPIDSATYSYDNVLCNSLAVKFYNDANSNCVKDSSESFFNFPITTIIDSNNIPIDTISATSGFYYSAYGSSGDIYTFRVLTIPVGIVASCSSGGTITDTLRTGMYNTSTKNLALSCTSSPGFDLAQYASAKAGRHMFAGDVIINNTYCTPQPTVFTMNISPKYSFQSASPAPSVVSGNTVTWNFTDVSANTEQPHIHFTCEVPGTWLMPGDTIHSDYMVTPTTGDLVSSNNTRVKVDVVTSSFDPNEMLVSPEGYITSGTQLQYTIHFENDGNDTAENIYILDTISTYVIPSSMRIIASSAIMNVIPIKSGAYNILKFDFPHIKLPDSSHHDACNGMVMFTLNTRTGLPYGTVIPNRAGIYFDDNEVVMTNTVENIIPYPSVCCLPPVKGNVSIYPNPANDELMVRMDYGGYSSFTISNSIGQTLVQRDLTGNITKVDLRSFASGMYYITLRGESGTQVQKFVKK